MAVGYGICDLGEDVKRTFPVLTPARLKTPFQRYIKLASACIIALWLLAMAFLIWEDVKTENSRLKGTSNQPGLASSDTTVD